MGNFSPWSIRRVNLNSIVGSIAPNYNKGLTSLNFHDFIILMRMLMTWLTTEGFPSWLLVILPIGTLGYNEIQIILLIGTSRYNISEYILKLQIHQHSLLTRKEFSRHNSLAQVFFTGSNMDHHQVIFKSRSFRLDNHHHYYFRYLKQMVLSLNSTRHRNFYRANPFSCCM